MTIQYFLNFDEEQTEKIIDIEIDKNATLGELITKLHEQEKIPLYRELKWDDNVTKISCSYYVLPKPDSYDYIRDLEQKISEFPLDADGKLNLYIDNSIGLAN